MSLRHGIKQAKDFTVWLHERTNERNYPDGVRHRVSHAILQLSEDIGDAILVLLDANLPGPALSLARPLFESYVRGYWLLNCASDEQVEQFLGGKCPNFAVLLASIPMEADSGGKWIHENCEKNLKTFHDLTHGGSEHVKRRINKHSVEPSYSEEDLVSLLKLGNEIRIHIGVEFLSRLNDGEGMEKLHQWSQALRTFRNESN